MNNESGPSHQRTTSTSTGKNPGIPQQNPPNESNIPPFGMRGTGNFFRPQQHQQPFGYAQPAVLSPETIAAINASVAAFLAQNLPTQGPPGPPGPSGPSGPQGDNALDNMLNPNWRWNPSEVGFFDPMFDDKSSVTGAPMEHAGKDTYFRDVHLFIERLNDIAVVRGEKLVRENLFTCLRGLALQWYTSELTSDAKLVVKYGDGIINWEIKLLERFKERPNVSMAVLMRERYTVDDARKHREPREYASTIIQAAKCAELANPFNQILLIYNGLHVEFQRDLHKPTNETNLNAFLQELDDYKDIWWQLAARQNRSNKPDRLDKEYRTSRKYNNSQTQNSNGWRQGNWQPYQNKPFENSYPYQPYQSYHNPFNRQQYTQAPAPPQNYALPQPKQLAITAPPNTSASKQATNPTPVNPARDQRLSAI